MAIVNLEQLKQLSWHGIPEGNWVVYVSLSK